MYEQELVKTGGEFGIFRNFLGFFNAVNMRTKQISMTMNFCTEEEAVEYVTSGKAEKEFLEFYGHC